MSELVIRVRAEYESAIACREEIKRLEREMKNLNEDASPEKLDKLIKRHAELTASYDKSMSFVGKSMAFIKDAFQSSVQFFKKSVEGADDMSNSAKSAVDAAKQQLDVEQKILDIRKKQREEAAEALKETTSRRDERTAYKDKLEKSMASLYGGAPESSYSENDRKELQKTRDDVKALDEEWENLNAKVLAYDHLIEDSTERVAKAKSNVQAFDGVKESASVAGQSIEEMLDKFLKLREQTGEPMQFGSMEENAEATKEKINELMASGDKLIEMREKLANTEGKGFDEIRKDVEDYGAAAQDTADKAEQAFGMQAQYIEQVINEFLRLKEKLENPLESDNIGEIGAELAGMQVRLISSLALLEKIRDVSEGAKIDLGKADELKAGGEYLQNIKDKAEGLVKTFDSMGRELKNIKFNTDEANAAFEQYASKATSLTDQFKSTLRDVATLAGVAFGLSELKSFVSKVAETRGYYQDIESSMEVFLGSQEKSAEFTKKLKDYAYYNMFEFSDLAKASQEMIAYGQEVDNIIPRLDQLSNVAVGTHGSLLELVGIYNRAKSTGVVDGQAIKSWATKGVVIKDVLKEMGEQAVGTTVTFEQLNKVLDHITAEAGMFHDIQGKMMENISAEQGQLEDNLSAMFNKIGEQYQDVIIQYYKTLSDMANNYEEIGGGFLDLGGEAARKGIKLLSENWRELIDYVKLAIGVYGSWKVALATSLALEKLYVAFKKTEAVVIRANAIATAADTGAKYANVTATTLLKMATNALNASMLASPWTWVAVAMAGVLTLTYRMATAQDRVTSATNRAKSALDSFQESIEEMGNSIKTYIATIADENASEADRLEAYEKLKRLAPDLVGDKTIDDVKELAKNEKELNEAVSDFKFDQDIQKAKDLQEVMSILRSAYEKGVITKEEIKKVKELSGKYFEALQYTGVDAKLVPRFEEIFRLEGDELRAYLTGYRFNPKKIIEDYSPLHQIYRAYESLSTQFKDDGSERANYEVLIPNLLKQSAVTGTGPLLNLEKSLEKQMDAAKERGRLVSQANMSEEQIVKNINQQNALVNAQKKLIDQTLVNLKDGGKSVISITEEEAQKSRDAIDDVKKKIPEIDKQFKKIDFVTPEKKEEAIASIDSIYSSLSDNITTIAKSVAANPIDVKLRTNATEALGWLETDIKAMVAKINDKSTPIEIKLKYQDKIEELQKAIQTTKTLISSPNGINITYDDALSEIDNMQADIQSKLEANPGKEKFVTAKESLEQIQEDLETAKAEMDEKGVLTAYLKIKAIYVGLGEETNIRKGYHLISPTGEVVPDEKPETHAGSYWSKQKTQQIAQLQKQKADLANQQFASQADYDAALQKIDNQIRALGGGKKTGSKNTQNDKRKREAQAIRDAWDYQEKLAKAEREAEDARIDAEIAAIENAGERERAERAEQHRRTLRDLELQQDEIYKEIYERRKKEWENSHKDSPYELTAEGRKGYGKDEQGKYVMTLSAEEEKYFKLRQSVLTSNADKEISNRKRVLDEQRKAEKQAYLNFLKDYGTYEQQRYAIMQEWAEKRKELTDPYEIAAGEAKMKQDLENLDNGSWKDNIDWEGIFNNLEGHTKGYLEGLRTQLQDLLASGKITDIDDMAVVQEKISEINQLIAQQGGFFSNLSPLMMEYNRRLEAEQNARARLEQARQNEAEAKNKYDTLMSGIFGEDAENFNPMGADFADKVKEWYGAESDEYKKALSQLPQLIAAEQDLADARKDTKTATDKLENAEDANNKTLKDKWAGTVESITTSKTYENVSGVPDLLKEMGLGDMGDKAQKGLDGFNDSLGAVTDFMSGNYVQAATKAISAIKNFGEALGAWSNSNRAEVEADNKRLTEAMNINTEAINRLTDAMQKGSAFEAFDIYEQQRQLMEMNEKNAKEIMLGNAHLYDGGHSLNYDLDDANGVIEKIYKLLNKNGYNTDLDGLIRAMTGADWNKLYETEEGRELWRQLADAISSVEDDGNYNGILKDFMDFASEYSEEAYGKLIDNLREKVTGISFDSMYSSFVSSLMDMDKSAKQFSQDFEGYIRQALYQGLADDLIKEELKKWQGAWAYYMNNDKKLDKTEINRLMHEGGTYEDENHNIVTFQSVDALESIGESIRNSVEALGLYNGKNGQTATMNSISNISYDQADSMDGTLIAQLIVQEQIKALLEGMGIDTPIVIKKDDIVTDDNRLDLMRDAITDFVNPEDFDLAEPIREQRDAMVSLLDALPAQLMPQTSEQRDISADSRDILAGMAIHVEEIRDGVVDTIVPRIKNIDSNLTKVYKLVEAQ